MGFAIHLVTIKQIMSLWTNVNGAVWIAVVWLVVVIVNLLNVRKYGEVEFWLTSVKVWGILVIIVLGVLLPLGASVGTRKLGIGDDNAVVPCLAAAHCLDAPGLNCLSSQANRANGRLGRGSIPFLFLPWSIWSPSRILVCMLSGILRLFGCETAWNRG